MSTDASTATDLPRDAALALLEQAQQLMRTIREKLGETAFGSITKWLGREVELEQYARLAQAGDHAEDKRTSLASVFVDLPVSSTPHEEHDDEGGSAFGSGFLQHMCQHAFERGDQSDDQRWPMSVNGEISEPKRSESRAGITLVGGPGQGKSTLGQLLCQLHRAWLLKTLDNDLLEESPKKVVDAFTQESAQKSLGIPAKIAFPIRIILPDAAAWLSAHEVSAGEDAAPRLLQYVANLSQTRQVPIHASDLARIVQAFRTVLVLDGLDEVMAIDDRHRLIAEMRALFAYVCAGPSPLLVVTTRPQGYADEIAFPKLHLVSLGRTKALQYARRLVDARFQDDRREVVHDRLKEAASGETTSRLMRSPLQITIMTTLVSALGRAPNERWSLFKEYYRVIYEREMERRGDTSRLLSDYREYIDKIHTQVGLLLQIEAEHSGGTASRMPRERFQEVIHAVLAEDGIDGAERDEIAQKLIGEKGDRTAGLMRVMGDRLVLLVEATPNDIGFEVRSIQEFMAAWALSLKDEKTVERRLWRIVKAASFRNVLLFLASRIFKDLDVHGLRDALVDRICLELNEGKDDLLARATLAGSTLALEILDEGSAVRQTKYLKKLVQLAVRIVELPPSPVHTRLVRVLLRDPEIMRAAQALVESALVARLGNMALEDRLGAWVVLLDLAAQGQSWAQRLAEAKWEESAEGVGERFGYALENANVATRDWFVDFLATRLKYLEPSTLYLWLRRASIDPTTHRHRLKSGPLHALFTLLRNSRHISIRVLLHAERTPLHLRTVCLEQDADADFRALAEQAAGLTPFAPLVAAAHLILNPTAATLARQLEYVAAHYDKETIERFVRQLPWPLAACLNAARSAEALRELARRVQGGELGDCADWQAAEKRWRQAKSLEFDDLIHLEEDDLPWSGKLVDGGFPSVGAEPEWTFHHPPISWTPLLDALRINLNRATRHRVKTLLADWFTDGLRNFISDGFRGRQESITTESADGKLPDDITAKEARHIFDLAGSVRLDVVAAMQPWNQTDSAWIDLLDNVGKTRQLCTNRAPLGELSAYLSQRFNENPLRTGLMFALRLCANMGVRTTVDETVLKSGQWANDGEREDAFLIQLAQGGITPDEAIEGAKIIARASVGPRYPLGAAVNVLEHVPDDAPYLVPTLLALLEHAPPLMFSWCEHIIQRLRRIAGSRPTRLDDDEVWTDLALPLPRPLRKTAPSSAFTELAREPVRIESIHLENVRTIKSLNIEPAPPHNGSGQWIVLVGENGTGKTTILRSIVLALRRIGTLPDTVHESSFRRYGLGRDEPCIVDVRVGGKTYAVRVDADNKGLDNPMRREDGDYEVSAHFPLFAYGARRGSALGGAKPEVNFNSPKEIETLFREGAGTNHAETWLVPIYLNPKTRPVWETIESVLRALLPGLTKIDVDATNRMWFEGEGIDRTTASGLSDGYLMTLGWVVDLLSRYVHEMEQRKEPIEKDFHEQMTGLVIIDEPDEFLHPMWQRQLIKKVRDVFPKMSFVVTTHNPLTLLGAKAEEIWRLERRGGDLVATQGRETPALMTGSDLYDAYFGIESVFPDELGQWLDRYGFLARNPVRTADEDAEARQLLAALRGAGVDPGFEPIPLISLSDART